MKRIIVAFAILACAATASAQSDSYNAALKKYMEASGSIGAFKSAITGMLGNFKSMNTSVPEEVWKEFETELLSTSVGDLVVMLAPVYEKHMTEADLNEIIKFYNSPVGKKLAEKTPAITQESMQAGQLWGQAVAQKVMQKLKEKGY
jgi:hypothetical protein